MNVNILFSWRSFSLLTLLASAILLPPIRFSGGIPALRPEFALITVIWAAIISSYAITGKQFWYRRSPIYKWFVLIVVSVLTSTLYGAFFKGVPLVPADFWELGKPILYLLIFLFVMRLSPSESFSRKIFVFCMIVFVLSTLVGFMQYFDVGGINDTLSPYYAPTQMRGLIVHGRIVGTTSNPNKFGALMVLAASLALSGSLAFSRFWDRLACLVLLSVFITALVLTASRTALVALVATTSTVVILFVFGRGFRRKIARIFLVAVVVLCVSILGFQFVPEKILGRFAQLENISEASSFRARVEKYWKPNFELWLNSPLFGWGPAKATMHTFVDNEWLLFLRRYGILGSLILAGFFIQAFVQLSRTREEGVTCVGRALSLSMQGSLVGWAIFMMAAELYHDMQLMSVFVILLGLSFSVNGFNRFVKTKRPNA